ncbi:MULTISPECIES: deaminase domain-containing protein [Spirulina sp. CCY15215]|uniref:deaminase domain-containing protein n=1 Tax=Spirulina sp. CCY15215 TaxID=2767591 RepID=UPI00195294D0|nr:deaminase domain-containing protein [Spirulina major]
MKKQLMSSDALLLRELYLKKKFPRGNVAIIEVYLADETIFCAGATSQAKSPSPKPKPRSQGGQFEPIVDSHSQRMMDTDAEYKAFSAIAETLEQFGDRNIIGKLYLYTERKPCESCENVIEQFQQQYPKIEIAGIFWDHPYPTLSS